MKINRQRPIESKYNMDGTLKSAYTVPQDIITELPDNKLSASQIVKNNNKIKFMDKLDKTAELPEEESNDIFERLVK